MALQLLQSLLFFLVLLLLLLLLLFFAWTYIVLALEEFEEDVVRTGSDGGKIDLLLLSEGPEVIFALASLGGFSKVFVDPRAFHDHCDLVWFGLVWFGLVWFGLVWYFSMFLALSF
jgi:hypothetical protein